MEDICPRVLPQQANAWQNVHAVDEGTERDVRGVQKLIGMEQFFEGVQGVHICPQTDKFRICVSPRNV